MKENTKDIAKNYAKALYNSAKSNNLHEKIIQDILALSDLIQQKDLWHSLSAPILSKSKQKELIKELSLKLNLESIITDFLYIVTDKGRLNSLEEIFKAYQKIYLKNKGVMEVEVETAVLLTDTQKETLIEKLKQKWHQEILLHQKLNEQILGGLILRYKSYEIDDSLIGKVKTIEKIMKGL